MAVQPPCRRGTSILLWLFCVSTITSAGLAGVLWRQRCELDAIRHSRLLYPGDRVGPLTGTDLAGQPAVVPVVSRHGTVLYVFAADCPHCQRNVAAVHALYARLRDTGIAFYGIALNRSGVPDRGSGGSDGFPVVIPDDESIRSFKLGSTPQTVFIAPNATVSEVWLGEYVGKVKRSIESTFKISVAASVVSGARERIDQRVVVHLANLASPRRSRR